VEEGGEEAAGREEAREGHGRGRAWAWWDLEGAEGMGERGRVCAVRSPWPPDCWSGADLLAAHDTASGEVKAGHWVC
jgi:hypothetical protein